MAHISLRLVDGGTDVQVALADVSPGAQSELEYALMQAGGAIAAGGIRISAFRFRRDARGIAALLRRSGAEITMDPDTEGLLRLQLEEIRARQAAETDLHALDAAAVEEAVSASGRFGRALTARQVEISDGSSPSVMARTSPCRGRGRRPPCSLSTRHSMGATPSTASSLCPEERLPRLGAGDPGVLHPGPGALGHPPHWGAQRRGQRPSC